MATTATATAEPATAAAPAAKKGKGKKLIVVVLLLLVVAGGGGFVFMKHKATPTPAADPTKEPGAVVDLAPMTLNLADGRYLKVGLALQLSEAASPATPAAGSDGSTPTSTIDGAKALDAAISVLGERTYAQLLAPGGRTKAQKQLTAIVTKRYDGQVLAVYFTEFVMQ